MKIKAETKVQERLKSRTGSRAQCSWVEVWTWAVYLDSFLLQMNQFSGDKIPNQPTFPTAPGSKEQGKGHEALLQL